LRRNTVPDFTRQAFFHCPTVENYSTVVQGSRGKSYTVRVGYSQGGATKFAWSCECPGFKFRHHCKHIDEAKQNYCGWSEFVHGGEVVRDENNVARCPKCGDPALAQDHAV
jgi:hypothetical protein